MVLLLFVAVRGWLLSVFGTWTYKESLGSPLVQFINFVRRDVPD